MKVSVKSLVCLFCAASWATSCVIAGEVEKENVPQKEEAPKAAEPIVLTMPKGTKMEFMPIPVGEFVMGSPRDEEGRDKDEDQVQVSITKAFYMGKTEVTEAQYSEMIDGVSPSDNAQNKPMTKVSWFDATAFCKRLTAWAHAQGKMLGWKFTLPTEAQWEYACRAGTTTKYHSGNEIADLKRVACYSGGSGKGKNQVARKAPNAWGLYDMHGNVDEWCLDWYRSRLRGGVDPAGSVTGSRRVIRGGGGDCSPRSCRSADRFYDAPTRRGYDLGFRVALVRE